MIGSQVNLGANVTIGPYTVIDGQVEIGAGCRIGPHCHISGATRIGRETKIHAGAIIGDEPQDRHFHGDQTFTEIGEKCVIREYVTIHRGTSAGTSTLIGSDVMLMAFVHVAHNCQIGDAVNIANGTILGGHVTVGRRAFLSAGIKIHQFVHVGTLAMCTGDVILTRDIPPYCLVGKEGYVNAVNIVGLRRAELKKDARTAIKNAFHIYYREQRTKEEALNMIRESYGHYPEIIAFIEFIQQSQRGILPGPDRARKMNADTGSDDESEEHLSADDDSAKDK